MSAAIAKEETLIIETPERVPLHFALASIGNRFLECALVLFIVVGFFIWTSYFVIFEWAWNGQTPGKRWLRLRVIREDGRPITFWEAAARNLLRIFDIQPFPFYSVGLISVFISLRD